MNPERELDLHIEQIGAFISASEDWSDEYRRDDATFKKLVQGERKIDTIMRGYFKDLSNRIVPAVDWEALAAKQAADDFQVKVEIDWNQEQQNIFNLNVDQFMALQMLGVNAGEILYSYELDIDTMTKRVLEAARAHAAEMSKTVNETTIRNVRSIIEVAIRDGMNQADTSQWLQDYINNPVRADMIARTETVNSYSRGILTFGDESGAIAKTWASLPTVQDTERCVNNETVPIDQKFSNGLLCPAAHVYCRCGLVLIYPHGG